MGYAPRRSANFAFNAYQLVFFVAFCLILGRRTRNFKKIKPETLDVNEINTVFIRT